jgi:hypothetical protein
MVEFDTMFELSNLQNAQGQEKEYIPDESLRNGK